VNRQGLGLSQDECEPGGTGIATCRSVMIIEFMSMCCTYCLPATAVQK
jgi:hypothetical protein